MTARVARWALVQAAAFGQAVAYTTGLFGAGMFLADSPRAHHVALLTLTAVLAIT